MSVWDTEQIRALVREWHGDASLKLRILTREEEIAQFEDDHPEVMPVIWEYVNHGRRLFRMWAKLEPCIDIVVWHPQSMSHRLIQDVFPKDAYPSVEQWHAMIEYTISNSSWRMWIVEHLD